LNGKVSHVVGAGQPGLSEGSFEQAQFNQPQGMALSEDSATLYVADTENHALRAVDLKDKTVTTLAGTGQQSYDRRPDGPGKTTPLSSPWDVARVGKKLFIASAGTHQIWQYALEGGQVSLFAGTGRELSEDGPHLRAMFAQPSGLATDGKTLYVADSETSSIRALDVDPEGQSRLLAGSADLFGFGLKDGVGSEALFQHPLGVALSDDTLFVADTFNGVIRAIDPKTKDVKTWLGTGKREPGDEADTGFYEPGGLSVAGDTLYIADTNHHRVVAVNVKTRKARVVDVRLAPK
jgi:DNA-binding beta-propeller fold protein YncE